MPSLHTCKLTIRGTSACTSQLGHELSTHGVITEETGGDVQVRDIVCV